MALNQMRKNIEYHTDMLYVAEEVRITFGVGAMGRLRYSSYADGLTNDDIVELSESVPSLTNSPTINAIALLLRADIAEHRNHFLTADSLHLKTAELYPFTEGRYYQGHINWAHTALQRWMIAPILRNGNYDESLSRLSFLNSNYVEQFSDLISFFNCNLKLLKGNIADM